MIKFKDVKESVELLTNDKTLEIYHLLQAAKLMDMGPIPTLSPLMISLGIIKSFLDSNASDPEFKEWIRTKVLETITPRGE
jgi:hypothetical protein